MSMAPTAEVMERRAFVENSVVEARALGLLDDEDAK
jgi:hypothetical protein